MSHHHVAVVIDHHEARILHVDEHDTVHVRAHHHAQAHKEGHRPHPDTAFFHAVAHALADAEAIILIGPGTAKAEFKHYLEQHSATVARRVLEVVTVDHPTDRQLAALAREHFTKLDKMQGKHVAS